MKTKTVNGRTYCDPNQIVEVTPTCHAGLMFYRQKVDEKGHVVASWPDGRCPDENVTAIDFVCAMHQAIEAGIEIKAASDAHFYPYTDHPEATRVSGAKPLTYTERKKIVAETGKGCSEDVATIEFTYQGWWYQMAHSAVMLG